MKSGHVTMEKGRLLTDTDYWYLPFCILYGTRAEVGGRTTNFWAVMQSKLKLMSKAHISGKSVREKCPLVQLSFTALSGSLHCNRFSSENDLIKVGICFLPTWLLLKRLPQVLIACPPLLITENSQITSNNPQHQMEK